VPQGRIFIEPSQISNFRIRLAELGLEYLGITEATATAEAESAALEKLEKLAAEVQQAAARDLGK
jgi:hypothetical protein